MRYAAIVAALTCWASASGAASLTYTEDARAVFSPGETIDRTEGGASTMNNILYRTYADGFNTSLGTLTGVRVTSILRYRLDGRLEGDRLIFGLDEGEGRARGSVETRMEGQALNSLSLDVDVECSDVSTSSRPNCPRTEVRVASSIIERSYTAAAWDALVGLGSIEFQTRVVAQAFLYDGDFMAAQSQLQSGSNYRIAYTYDTPVVTPQPSTVPLPAGLPLILVGVGALGWLKRGKD